MANIKKISVLATAVLLGSLAIPAIAQPAPGDGGAAGAGAGDRGDRRDRGNRGDGGGGGGNFDLAQFRQRMNERLKESLGATDEEFQALQPKIERVQQLQRDTTARSQMFGRRGGGGGGASGGRGGDGAAGGGAPGGGGPGSQTAAMPAQPTSPVQEKVKELQTTIDNKDAKPEEIKAKLDSLREAKAKAKEELAKAQQELREIVTQRQEAVLVTQGILD